MAYEEYLDLIKRSKTTGKYVIYSLDGKGDSRKDNPKLFIEKSFELMDEMTKIFFELENSKQILVRDDIIKINFDPTNYNKNEFACNYNPNLVNGDLISFYFYKDSIDIKTFIKIFDKASKNINNNFEYHLAIQEYETNDYLKASKLLWVGYAQQYLNNNKSQRIALLNSKIKR